MRRLRRLLARVREVVRGTAHRRARSQPVFEGSVPAPPPHWPLRPSEPPAHWVERVAVAAPELLRPAPTAPTPPRPAKRAEFWRVTRQDSAHLAPAAAVEGGEERPTPEVRAWPSAVRRAVATAARAVPARRRPLPPPPAWPAAGHRSDPLPTPTPAPSPTAKRAEFRRVERQEPAHLAPVGWPELPGAEARPVSFPAPAAPRPNQAVTFPASAPASSPTPVPAFPEPAPRPPAPVAFPHERPARHDPPAPSAVDVERWPSLPDDLDAVVDPFDLVAGAVRERDHAARLVREQRGR